MKVSFNASGWIAKDGDDIGTATFAEGKAKAIERMKQVDDGLEVRTTAKTKYKHGKKVNIPLGKGEKDKPVEVEEDESPADNDNVTD